MYVYLPPTTSRTSLPATRSSTYSTAAGRRRRMDHHGSRPNHHGQLIDSGKAVPMIVVMPNGNAKQTVSQGFGLGPTPAPQQVNAPAPPPMQAAAQRRADHRLVSGLRRRLPMRALSAKPRQRRDSLH